MNNVSSEVQEMTCEKHMAHTFGSDRKCAFEAVDRDLSGHLVRRQ